MTATRQTLLAELRATAADRPAHALALEKIIAWYEKWYHDQNAAPADPTDGMPGGCSARVAVALDDDVCHAFGLQPGPTNVPPPRAYAGRRHIDAAAAADRTRTRDRLSNLLPGSPR